MTKKTITICDSCDKELELGLFKDHAIWTVSLDLGAIDMLDKHFCCIEHLREYFRDKTDELP